MTAPRCAWLALRMNPRRFDRHTFGVLWFKGGAAGAPYELFAAAPLCCVNVFQANGECAEHGVPALAIEAAIGRRLGLPDEWAKLSAVASVAECWEACRFVVVPVPVAAMAPRLGQGSLFESTGRPGPTKS